MKLLGLANIDGSANYKVVVDASAEETAGLLATCGLVAAAAAEPAKRTRKAAEPEAPKAETKPAPAETKPAATTTAPAKTNGATNGTTAAATPAVDLLDADEPVSDIPAELSNAKVLSEIVRHLMTKGISTKDAMIAECQKWKAQGGDKIPVLARIENLAERIERGGTAMGLT